MDVKLHLIKGATLVAAQQADHKERDFVKSASLYYSVFKNSNNLDEKAWAFGGLLLQLGNAGDFQQVKEYTKTSLPSLLKMFPLDKRNFLEADVQEKLGRIEFSQKNYKRAIKYFTHLQEILLEKGQKNWTIEDQKAFSTAEHFLGLSLLGLVKLNKLDRKNLQLARKHFQTAISCDEKIRGDGREETVGYGYKALAESYLIEGDLVKANKAIEKAKRSFIKYIKVTPKSKVLAEYHEVKGKIQQQEGKRDESKKHFEEASKIRKV